MTGQLVCSFVQYEVVLRTVVFAFFGEAMLLLQCSNACYFSSSTLRHELALSAACCSLDAQERERVQTRRMRDEALADVARLACALLLLIFIIFIPIMGRLDLRLIMSDEHHLLLQSFSASPLLYGALRVICASHCGSATHTRCPRVK